MVWYKAKARVCAWQHTQSTLLSAIGWFCIKCSRIMTVNEYEHLHGEKQNRWDLYKHMKDDYWRFMFEQVGYGSGGW
jgi:hypothetical protein